MNKRLKKALKRIKAGEFEKCNGSFTDSDGNFCILGALTKCYEEETGDALFGRQGQYEYENEEEKLQPRVARYYGFLDPGVKVLWPNGKSVLIAWVNDETDRSLSEIAELIEEQEQEITRHRPKRVKKGLPEGAARVPVFLPVPQKKELA